VVAVYTGADVTAAGLPGVVPTGWPEVTAQRLTDLLAELRRAPGLAVTVLE
jgi:hypothetical protein